MKQLSQQELKLAEEMFTSTAKIISMIQYQEMDKEKLKRYEDFFINRYKSIIGCSSCIILMKRLFHQRLASDTQYADVIAEKAYFLRGRNYEDNTSFEECLIIAKGIFKTEDYTKFYSEIFKTAYEKAVSMKINDLNYNPADMVRGVVSNIVLTLVSFLILYKVTSGTWDLMTAMNYIDKQFPSTGGICYYNNYSDERSIKFELMFNLMTELENADPGCVNFDEKKEETA